MAERIVVIDHGRVIADDTPARLKADLAGDGIVLTFADEDAARHAAGRAPRLVGGTVTRAGTTVRVRVADAPGRLPGLLEGLSDAGLRVAAAEVIRPTLDDVFLNLTGRSLREGGAATEFDTAFERELEVAA